MQNRKVSALVWNRNPDFPVSNIYTSSCTKWAIMPPIINALGKVTKWGNSWYSLYSYWVYGSRLGTGKSVSLKSLRRDYGCYHFVTSLSDETKGSLLDLSFQVPLFGVKDWPQIASQPHATSLLLFRRSVSKSSQPRLVLCFVFKPPF